MPINYKEVKNQQKFDYSLLDSKVQKNARLEVIGTEIFAFRRSIFEIKGRIKTDIHNVINENRKYKSFDNLIQKKQFINKLTNNIDYCNKFISGNLCYFLSDGTYITYSNTDYSK